MGSLLGGCMLDLIWDVWQWQRIREVEEKQRDAGGRVTDVQERLRGLDETVGRLMTTTAAMWSLVKEKTGATDEELLARVKKLEAEQAEGRVAVKCGKCGRTVPSGKKRCMYCGEER